MKAILIAEKPSLMREIQAAYNENRKSIPMEIDFLAQAGHLVGLKMPEEIDEEKYGKWRLDNFPIDVPYVYKVIPGKTDLVSKIKNAVKSKEYDFVIHAGDPDGEGELLIRLVLDYVGNPLPVKRFWSNDLTHGAIANALRAMRDDSEYDSVYNAALVRQHADYQFGMNVTGTATLMTGELFKLGRVKAPIIKMIVDREREIRSFEVTSTWKQAFTFDGCEFVCDDEFKTKEACVAVFPDTDKAVVSSFKAENKSHAAPKLFKLSTLQTEAHKVLRMSVAGTLSTLQSLYEAKLVSYPRTDCEYISSAVDLDSIVRGVVPVIGVDKGSLVRSSAEVKKDRNYANDAAIAQEGHTAIIPTGLVPGSLTPPQAALYELVCRRFLSIFAAPKVVKNVTCVAYPDGDENLGKFVWKESYDVDPGYELVANPKYSPKAGTNKTFERDQELRPIEFSAKECVAKPPARYNEGSLIAALDKPEAFKDDNGKVAYKIGTPATRAGIIEDCIRCGYFEKDKKGVYTPTPKAERIVDEIGDISLFQVTNSGRWESLLEQIRQGKANPMKVEEELLSECHAVVSDIKARNIAKGRSAFSAEVLGKCPSCGADVVVGKYGAYCKGKCGMIVSKAVGKALTKKEIASLLAGKKTLVKGIKSKSGKIFDAYLTPKGIAEFSYVDKAGNPAVGKSFEFQMDFVNKKK